MLTSVTSSRTHSRDRGLGSILQCSRKSLRTKANHAESTPMIIVILDHENVG